MQSWPFNDQQVDKTILKIRPFGLIVQAKHKLLILRPWKHKDTVKPQFFLGLDYECHYAKYQQGDFYKKHYDAFEVVQPYNRCYLNTPIQVVN